VKSSSFRRVLIGWAYGGVPIVFLSFVALCTLRADPAPPFRAPVSYWAVGLFAGLVASGSAAVAFRAPSQGVRVIIYAVGMSLALGAAAIVTSVAAGDIH
jgi:hypothetical protein